MSFRLLSELYSLLLFPLPNNASVASLAFPSPLGVIFSLIIGGFIYVRIYWRVSVSSRSYILSYKLKMNLLELNIMKVSVSSRSYILSYLIIVNCCFKVFVFPSPLGVIFSLIGDSKLVVEYWSNGAFPSPLGVIFSLI